MEAKEVHAAPIVTGKPHVMQIETAELSLIGDREDNQDRAAIAFTDDATLLVVADGMGGHSEGELAAKTAIESITRSFSDATYPVSNLTSFLRQTIADAHRDVVALGKEMSMESRPRATCAMCLIHDSKAYWAHVGDSRVYHLRDGKVKDRTRDHSHVELLLQDGVITEEETINHPLRNFVECCLGGESELPELSMSRARVIKPGDTILVCSDGLWSGVSDDEIAAFYDPDEGSLAECLEALAHTSMEAGAPWADNTTVAAMHCKPVN